MICCLINRFNEEMIENLFGYNKATEKNKGGSNKKSSSQDPTSNLVQIIDPKKAQNLSILLKALNVTTNEVSDALKEGNASIIIKYRSPNPSHCVVLVIILTIRNKCTIISRGNMWGLGGSGYRSKQFLSLAPWKRATLTHNHLF